MEVGYFCACTNPADSISPYIKKFIETTGVIVITIMPFSRVTQGRNEDASMSVDDFRIVGDLTRHHCVVSAVARVLAESNFVCC